jgi:hypothetical protein
MTKPQSRHCVRDPQTDKFAPTSAVVPSSRAFKKKATVGASKEKAAPAVTVVAAAEALKKKVAPSSSAPKMKVVPSLSVPKMKAMTSSSAVKKKAVGKKPLKNTTQESSSGSDNVMLVCRQCFNGDDDLCKN